MKPCKCKCNTLDWCVLHPRSKAEKKRLRFLSGIEEPHVKTYNGEPIVPMVTRSMHRRILADRNHLLRVMKSLRGPHFWKDVNAPLSVEHALDWMCNEVEKALRER